LPQTATGKMFFANLSPSHKGLEYILLTAVGSSTTGSHPVASPALRLKTAWTAAQTAEQLNIKLYI